MTWTVEDAHGHAMAVQRLGSGPPVVWLHGLGDEAARFAAIIAHPALAGWSHVVPDLPGYGRSPWPPDDNGDSAGDALARLADRLARWLAGWAGAPPAARPVVVGHSMGGVLALLLAERGAARAVVDLDGNLSAGDCTFSARAAAYPRPAFAAHGMAALRAAIAAPGPALRDYHAALGRASPGVFHDHAAALVAISATETLAARLAALAVPALFLAGVPDGICAHSRALLDRHRVRWCGIAPAGHWPHVDQPAAVAAAIAVWLSEIRGSVASE